MSPGRKGSVLLQRRDISDLLSKCTATLTILYRGYNFNPNGLSNILPAGVEYRHFKIIVGGILWHRKSILLLPPSEPDCDCGDTAMRWQFARGRRLEEA